MASDEILLSRSLPWEGWEASWWGKEARETAAVAACRINISAGFACGSNLARSGVTSPFFLSYQTYANSRRDGTRRAANERGRGCGKVRQYEQTCRWSVPPVQSVENHSLLARSLSFRLFVFVSCAPGSATTNPACSKLVKRGFQRTTRRQLELEGDKSRSRSISRTILYIRTIL